jgi:hypothetical protein
MALANPRATRRATNSRLFWPRGAGEPAVLSFQEAPGVDHDGHEELTLPLREAEITEGTHPAHADAVERRVPRVFVRHRNSSTTRGCGWERPLPPRDPTT